MSELDAGSRNDIHYVSADKTQSPVWRILFLSRRGNLWRSSLSETEYIVDPVGDVNTPARRLNDSTHQLIVLDDASFGDDIYQAITECKRLNPLLPVLALTSNEALDYQANLLDAGVDDVLLMSYSADYLKRRLDIHIRRFLQKRATFRRNGKLYDIAMLTGQLHAHNQPQTLIQEAIRAVTQTFVLYGVSIAIPENGILRIYSGQAEHQKANQIIQTLHDPDPKEPFNRVLQTGHMEFFEDITLDLHYSPLPMLPQVCSAILVPLKYQAEIMGVIAVFGRMDEPVSIEDVVIYEMLATQIAGILQNANFTKAQDAHIHVNQTLLTAWQTLLTVQTFSGIIQTLRRLVEELSSVDKALIWINGQESGRFEVFTSDPRGQVEQVFREFLNHDDTNEPLWKISDNPHIVFQLGLSANDPLVPLFRALHARQLIFMSIQDSTRLIGGILTSVSNDRQFSLEDANLVRSLSYAAGQALERMILIDAMSEKSGRLEAVLRSITEGIFFVDSDGKIAFCNPQLTELTGLSPSEILNQRPEVLLNLLAEQTVNPDTAREHFYNAVHTLQNWAGNDRSYPIVELTLRDSRQSIHVEFVVFDRLAAAQQSWVGIVGASVGDVSKWDTPSEAADLLLHSLHASGVQVSNLIKQVAQSRTRYDDFEQKQHLEALQKGAANFRLLLEQYAKFYNINITEADGSIESVDLRELAQEVIRKQVHGSKLHIHLDPALPSAVVEANRSLIERVLTRLLESTVQETTEPKSIIVSIKDLEKQANLSVEFYEARDLPTGELTPFDLVGTSDPNNAWADIYLYYALTQFHHCRIWTENRGNHHRAIVISVPKSQVTTIPTQRDDQAETNEIAALLTGAPLRSSRVVMLITGLSRMMNVLERELDEQGYEVLSYDSAEDAIRDINLTHFDLIVLDGDLADHSSLDMYKQLRRRTEVPVVIVATQATNQERVAALKAGVDDYITEPISREELLAKISVLFKRQLLADRTQQPLDLGDLRIDFARRAVWVDHKSITLTRIEYDLLRTLAVNMGQVLTHQQLLEKVWGPEYRSETQYLWVNISRLRKKLEPTNHIYNQQGIGYIFQNM